jgi:periplasmic mercuric ion binding protein
MKRIVVFLLIIFSSSIAFAQQNKDIVTEHYKVSGNCEQCKKRIENAAFVKGVKRAEWDVKTQELTVTFRSSQTSANAILQHIAKAGHDNELVKAEDADYKKLPHCCAYKETTNQ